MNKEEFDPKTFEAKWRKMWEEKDIYKTPDDITKEKFYSLYSYPYPSGAGLHVGHVEGMVANDIAARFNRMKGKNVLMPMGWDSFGLPAENYAIKTGVHPDITTEEAVKAFTEQINRIGISVDWNTEVGAHRPDYYKWTQWIFLQLFKKGLAYKAEAPVNWCPQDQTVLANEQVLSDGTCERCGSMVVQKNMNQWFFKITAFADRLLSDLDNLDWPESTKQVQRNWIGKSEGAEIQFAVFSEQSSEEVNLSVFSTAHDTIYGATFVVIAPENKIIQDLKSQITNYEEVRSYIENSKKKTELDRQQQKDKTGIKLEGIYAINPVNQKQIQIYVADYVLSTYGTGAIMAVPGHDDRDSEFAKKYNIETIFLVSEEKDYVSFSQDIKANPEKYTLKNSEEFNGMNFVEARAKILDKLVSLGAAKSKTEYKLRDWLLSRQRYWGCPIPIVYDPEGNAHPVHEDDLPVKLPHDVDFRPTGESPITRSVEFQKGVEEKYGKGWRREVDTMDTFVDSSWYFFRHIDPKNPDKFVDKNKADYWLPTDLYMIGAEHTVLHLLYSRFFTKALFDEGYIGFHEPFYRMRHMGTILGPDGRKMSKRWGNVINPNDEIAQFGADTLRIYEMFMGPLEESKAWNTNGEKGVSKFLGKLWELQYKIRNSNDEAPNVEQEKIVNKLIKKVTEDVDSLSFNTSIAKFMETVNFLMKEESINKDAWEKLLLTLAPFAPYITEELWSRLDNEFSIHNQNWPTFDPALVVDDVVEMAVQVNGKVRGTIQIEIDANEAKVVEVAKQNENISKYLVTEPKKIIYIQGRILNFII